LDYLIRRKEMTKFVDKKRVPVFITPDMLDKIEEMYPQAKKEARKGGVNLTKNEMIVGALEVGLEAVEDYIKKSK
jgi:ArsR family metal-binding transcriptional regulator